MSFKSQDRPGFQMKFKNGWTISVQWHTGAYCERKNLEHTEDSKPSESINAEIAAWDKDGNWYQFEHEQVLGWQTADEVAEWMDIISSLTD